MSADERQFLLPKSAPAPRRSVSAGALGGGSAGLALSPGGRVGAGGGGRRVARSSEEERGGFPGVRPPRGGGRRARTNSTLTRPRISDVEESEYESDITGSVTDSESGRRRPYHYGSQVRRTGVAVARH